MTPCRTLLAALALAAAAAPADAALILTTSTWAGMPVTLESPAEKITQGTRFNLALEVDSGPLAADDLDMRAFFTEVRFSDTVIFDAGSTWTYTFFSDDPDAQVTASGTLGDEFTTLTGLDTGTPTLDLADVRLGPFFRFSALTREFNDRLRWTFDGIIINGDTTYGVRLTDLGITGVPDADASVVVIDPPPLSIQATALPIDEPPAALLSLAGLGALGVVGWRERRRARRA